jgi:hypothetical protein
MFTTGSKLLIGSAVLATLFAIAYGVTQEGALGTIGLSSAALALTFLAGVNIYTRDSNVSVGDTGATTVSAAARPAPAGSPWPFVAAAGLAIVAIGLVTDVATVILGLVVVLAATVEWMVQAWSERASADPAFNHEIRERIADPLQVPILATLGGAVVIFFFSRVMLSLTKTGTVVAFSVVAALLLFVAFVFASRPAVSKSTVAGVLTLSLIALVAGGAVAGLSGERDIHVHETTADLAERGRCGTEKTEADKEASQTVGNKANVSANVTLGADGQLSFDQPGFIEAPSTLTLPRSNPNNVIFRNESPDKRRLVIDAGPSGDVESRVLCTALVEEGGKQLLTIIFDTPSFAVEDGYRFTVPGVDTAVLEVVVP